MQRHTIGFSQVWLVYGSPAESPLLQNGLRHGQITVALGKVSCGLSKNRTHSTALSCSKFGEAALFPPTTIVAGFHGAKL